MPSLPQILKSKIGKGGKSKTYVANELKVSEKTVENYMNGKRQPKPLALKKLAEVLDFSLDDLSNGVDGEQNVPRDTLSQPNDSHNGVGEGGIIDLRGRTIYNLSEGNRIQSETTAQLADSNQKLIDQNITLTRAAIGGADQQTFEETVLMVKGMRDFLIEFAADVKKVNPQEVLQALYSKVKEVKDQNGKTDNRAETSTRSR